jgi:Tfp pilus assembly protein PilE
MNPSAIIALAQICERQYQAGSKDTAQLISTFLTTWSTWEAVRTRLIRVIIHKQGWLIQDADAAPTSQAQQHEECRQLASSIGAA